MSEPLRFTDHGELDERVPLPPDQPPGWVDPEWLQVEPEPVAPRVAYQGWKLDPAPQPAPHWFALVGLGICIGIVIFALIFTIGRVVDAASRSGLTTDPIDLSRASSAAQSGAPHMPRSSAAPTGSSTASSSGTPSPTGDVGTALVGGWATYYATCPECAAAGPLLREALGAHWKGTWITVVSNDGQATLRLETSCACRDRRGRPTIIDVSIEAFDVLSPSPAGSATDPGYVAVSIELPTELPRTDADLRMMLEVRDDEVYR
jgi:hypothetical protein